MNLQFLYTKPLIWNRPKNQWVFTSRYFPLRKEFDEERIEFTEEVDEDIVKPDNSSNSSNLLLQIILVILVGGGGLLYFFYWWFKSHKQQKKPVKPS
ncbi:hypothetical protein GvMRE_IIg257 [endosymbiont GvMRE of Glomus versiforme]|nr:hypothetical protein GvMRE_IIg257 [endosymbiont GvMRE of Glomus versiforme]